MTEGRLFLVGLGPGAPEQMTGRARQAIAASEVVIGYSKYLDLIADLLTGKEVVRKGMTQELDRCVAACEQARRGRKVALVSSGDVGVYGMAALAYEVLLRSGWTPEEGVQVEAIPGVTALSACASLVGAPLGHDFCAVSLSDLLTPWPVIARRLESAARGDFVVALYNPRSGRRHGQLLEAQRILLRHRPPDTPVAIVNAAYRDGQKTQLGTLAEMTECEIGMLSTVLVGSRSSYRRAGLMITPRGYSDKYDGLTGALRAGERSGRSLSMGLDGWKACVRKHLREAGSPPLAEVARYFDAPVGEILSAIAASGDGDPAGDYAASAVSPGKETATLEEARHWGRVRIALIGAGDTRCELLMNARDLETGGGRLRMENASCRLDVDWSRVARGWFLRRGERLRGLEFVDAAGQTIFRLDLEDTSAHLDPEAVARYEQARRRLTAPPREPNGLSCPSIHGT